MTQISKVTQYKTNNRFWTQMNILRVKQVGNRILLHCCVYNFPPKYERKNKMLNIPRDKMALNKTARTD